MQAPDLLVDFANGTSKKLLECLDEGPVALIFLRQFGCTFCRRMVIQARRYPHIRMIFVGMGDRLRCECFASKLELAHPIISDPDRKLYTAFEVRRGNLPAVAHPKVWKRLFLAARYGIRPPQGDPMQLSASFVLNCEGDVTWCHRAKQAGDDPTIGEIREALLCAELSRTLG